MFVCTFFITSKYQSNQLEEETDLGFIANADITDDAHIIKEMRNLNAGGNMLMCNFVHYTENVKITRFTMHAYCCSMWVKCLKTRIRKCMLFVANI